MELKGKVALITGASSGIGEGVAKKLAEKGVKVALAARSEEKLNQLVQQLLDNGWDAFAVKMDVVDKESIRLAVEKIKAHYGTIDILVNNAGIMPVADIDTFKVDEWEQMVNVNIKGVLNVTAAVLPELIAQKSGHIINLSSIAGRKLFKSLAVYCGTKHFVAAFSDIMRMEVGKKHNVRVTSIQPGAVATNLYDQITDANYKAGMETLKDQMTFLTPTDIANSMVYALEAPDYVDVSEIFILPTDQEW